MARSNTLEHSADHRDEAAEYAASARNNDWNNSDFGEKFLEELKAINGSAAAAFDKQENLAEFREDRRGEFLEAYANGFNKMDFATDFDRQEAATGLAQNIYKPMFEQIELTEAGISKENAAKLTQMGYDKAEKHMILDEDGKTVESNVIMARSEEDARTIAVLTGGSIIQQNRILDFHLAKKCDEFAEALYQSRLDPEEAARRMQESFTGAMGFLGTEHDGRDNQNDPEAVDFQWISDTESDGSRKKALDFLAAENWKTSLQALEDLKTEEGWEAQTGAKAASEAMMQPYREGMDKAVEHGDCPAYKMITAGMKDASESFAGAIKNRMGFIDAAGYTEKPDLPEKFKDLEGPRIYMDEVGQVLDDYAQHTGNIDANVEIAVRSLETRMKESWKRGEQTENDHSDQDAEAEYKTMTRLAQGIDFLITPKNAEDAAIGKGVNSLITPKNAEDAAIGKGQDDTESNQEDGQEDSQEDGQEHGQEHGQEKDESTDWWTSEIEKTEDLIHQEITDSIGRRLPLALTGIARSMMEEASSQEEMDAAASISDRLISDVLYRYYFPGNEYEKKTDAEPRGEHAPETDISTGRSLTEIRIAEGQIPNAIPDSVGRRVPLRTLGISREFLEEASSQAEADMAMLFKDKALDALYQYYLPRHER